MKVPFLDLSLQHRSIREEALAALTRAYDAHRFILGSDVEAFERNFAAALGAPGAVGMNSGTSPLHIASLCGGFGGGDEVITTPFTFISTAWGIVYSGARPVFADIEPGTFNLDPAAVERAVSPRTKGIVAVHLFGQPAPMDELMATAQGRGLFVVEDCAQAVLARYRDTAVGLIGDAGTFSFYPTKNLGGCGEGGAFVSRRPELLERAALLRSHASPRRYEHSAIGFNYRMDGFQGAVLNVKLGRLAAWTERRRQIAARYLEEIRLADLVLPSQPEYGRSVFHQFTVRHPQRDALRAHLQQAGIGTDTIYPIPLHLQPCFSTLGYAKGDFPRAEEASATCLSLPIFPELTDEQVGAVVAAVNRF